MQQVSDRKTPFSLSGTGIKKIAVARPQVIATKNKVILIYRDLERGDKVSVAINKNINKENWSYTDITTAAYGQWELSYDTALWNKKRKLHLFLQKTAQGDGEKTEVLAPQMVKIFKIDFNKFR